MKRFVIIYQKEKNSRVFNSLRIHANTIQEAIAKFNEEFPIFIPAVVYDMAFENSVRTSSTETSPRVASVFKIEDL